MPKKKGFQKCKNHCKYRYKMRKCRFFFGGVPYIYIYIIQVRCIFVCSTRRSLPHMHDGLYVLFERAYSSFILCIKLVFMKMMLGFITPSSRKDGMTEGNAEAIMKYIQSVLVLPAQKRSLVKAMFSNRDGRRRHGA